MLYYEEFCGPYAVSGQEVRRSVSAHALHQAHCYQNGSPDANFNTPLSNGQARSLGSCGVCACSFWVDELMHLNLWVQPLAKDEITTNSSCLEAEECDEDALPLDDAACAESVEDVLHNALQNYCPYHVIATVGRSRLCRSCVRQALYIHIARGARYMHGTYLLTYSASTRGCSERRWAPQLSQCCFSLASKMAQVCVYSWGQMLLHADHAYASAVSRPQGNRERREIRITLLADTRHLLNCR